MSSITLGTVEVFLSATLLWKEYCSPMKPIPPPHVPGKTEFDRFDNAVRQVLTVSKDELLKREQREQDRKEREERRRPKK